MYLRLTEVDLQEVVYERDLPADFRTGKGMEESSFELKHRLGDASYHELWFEGIHVSHGRIKLNRDARINIEAYLPVVEMHFSLAGTSRSFFVDNKLKLDFEAKQHNIHYYPRINGTLEVTVDNVNNEMLEVHLTESYFRRLAYMDNPMFTRMVENIEKGKPAIMNRHNGHITPVMQQLIQQIRYNNRQGALKRLAIESSVLELMMLQVEQFEDDAATLICSPANRRDTDKLQQVRLLLEQDPHQAHTLEGLARQTGLNDFKLKKGFKELFGTTVFGYLHDLRMQDARRLLLDEHKTINEVADYCGYAYVQHFTTAFKKKFGVTPGMLRKAS